MTAYSAHERLVLPARTNPQLWKLALGAIVAFVIMNALHRAFFALVYATQSSDTYLDVTQAIQVADTPLGMLLLLFLMGALGVATVVAAELLQKRSLASLVGPRRAFVGQFGKVALALTALTFVLWLVPPWGLPEGTTANMALGQWLVMMPLSLVAIAIQTGSEELFFRGYLQTQLAARFKQVGVWMVVPSALFALGHYAPSVHGDNAWIVTLWAFLFGMAAADLTARSGSLGPAIALHLINNATAMTIVSLDGDMSGLALYTLPFGTNDEAAVRALLPLDLAALGVSWLAARVALKR